MTSILDPENLSLPKIHDAFQLRQQAVARKESMIFNELSPAKFAREASLQHRRQAATRGMESLQLAQPYLHNRNSRPDNIFQGSGDKNPWVNK
jgi:hypothetical protein